MRFLYLRDPLFLFCLVLYFANRWFFKPLWPQSFFASSLNDLMCIPFWMPPMLWFQRRVGLRKHDNPPEAIEILVPLLLWSWAFEILAPSLPPFKHLATADPNDILCYALGAAIAAGVWKMYYRETAQGERSRSLQVESSAS